MNNSFQKRELGSNIKVILDVKDEYISKFINITRERFKEGYKSICSSKSFDKEVYPALQPLE